jgi:hypothetical protein
MYGIKSERNMRLSKVFLLQNIKQQCKNFNFTFGLEAITNEMQECEIWHKDRYNRM